MRHSKGKKESEKNIDLKYNEIVTDISGVQIFVDGIEEKINNELIGGKL